MKVTKKLLSLWLALVMVVSLLPTTVLATEAELYDGAEAVEVLPEEAADVNESADDADAAPETEAEAEPEEIAPIEEIAISQEMPALNAAANGTTLVIAGSDFQNNSCTSTNHTAGTNAVRSLLAPIKSAIAEKYGAGTQVDGFLFCGDYYKDNGNQTAATNGLNALKACVTDELGSQVEALYVQGNHDVSGVPFDSTGAHDAAAYGVYEMNWDQYNGYSASYSASQTMAANLRTYFAGRKTNHPDQPVFIISHQGLHAGPRTIWGDTYNNCALYAMPIFEAINEAAAGEDGLTIIFLFAHNHSKDFDSYLGGSAVFLRPGDTMLVSNATNSSGRNVNSFTTQTLNFTYMNAGYVGYYDSYSDADSALTMTCFEINGSQVTISRYDTDGLHNLKAAGDHTDCTTERGTEMNNFIARFDPDATVYTSPQVVGTAAEPEPEEQTFTDPTGITVTTRYGTGLSVSVLDNTAVYDNIDAYRLYDISVADFVQGKTATVTIPVPAEFADTLLRVYHVTDDGKLVNMNASVKDGVASFTTDHFSKYMLASLNVDMDALEWVTIPGDATYSNNLTALSSLTTGTKIIIHCNQETTLYVTNQDNDNNRLKQVTGQENAAVWTVTKNSDNTYYLQDTAGKYLTIGNGTAGVTDTPTKLNLSYSNTNKWQISETVSTTTTEPKYTSVTVTETNYNNYKNNGYYYNDNGTYRLVNNITRDGTRFVISWDGGSYRTGKNTNSIRLYSKTTEERTTSTTYYLNRYQQQAQAAGYTSGANSDTGSRWQLHSVTYGSAHYAALSGPTEYTVAVGETLNLTNTVWYKASESDDPVEVEGDFSDFDTGAAGDKTVTVTYMGKPLGTITVHVMDVSITGINVSPANSEVYVNARASVQTGSIVTVTYSNGESNVFPMTLAMIDNYKDIIGTPGEYTDLTVTYGDKTFSGYTLTVLSRAGNDYPEYPKEGSVKVDKNATGIDFNATGVAKVNLSAVGVPMNKGIDVIVMLDTSSSMTRDATNKSTSDTSKQRITMLKNSLVEMTDAFKTPNADGSLPDIRMAIADFNGFTYLSGTSAVDYISQQNYDQPPTAQVYSGDKKLDAGAFVDVNSDKFNITAINNALTTTSGTNYDDAFDRIYQLGTAITEQNEASGESRELVVIFMSDGATFQYNYFHSRNTEAAWANWLDGSIDMNSSAVHGTHKYFKNGDANEHRMANAVKGSPDETYEVIRPDGTYGTPTGQDYMYNVPGLGATLYTIGFCITKDGSVPQDAIQANIQKLASMDKDGKALYYDAGNEAALTGAFKQIADNLKQAATEAYFVDTMGLEYDLQMATKNYTVNGSNKTLVPTITVTEYDAYKRSDIGNTVNGVSVTEDMVGKTYGTGTVKETVTFSADGKQAYSDLIGSTTNILGADGIIRAKNFYYNTTEEPIELTDEGITVYEQSFHWIIGAISEKVLTLSYYVYLTGSMEGNRDEGSYPTNEGAILYYKNWLENPAHKDTVSPVMPWGSATVSYAFYLVDKDGKPVVNRTTGETGSFANKVAMTSPAVHGKINLNSSATVDNIEVLANDVLPEGYSLYNEGAKYSITVKSSSGSNWVITDDSKTTYVTDYNGSEYTNQNCSDDTVDYTHTTVWFAVKYEIKAAPDTVVIDYGLPVDIHVLVNDMFGENGTLDSVGPEKVNDKTAKPAGFGSSIDTKYGTAQVTSDGAKNGTVRYTPKTMQMNACDTFAYAVKYMSESVPDNNGYYYGDVTVIPATTIYYEDSFGGDNGISFTGTWTTEGTTDDDATQAEDRPGRFSLSTSDANNVYGHDQANLNCSTYGLNSAHKVTVSAANNPKNGGKWPTATFTFTGTAFDVVSLTSNTTGYVQVEVKDSEDTVVARYGVDTYYGYTIDSENPYVKSTYTRVEDGMWHLTATETVKVKGTDENGATSRVLYTPNWVVTNNTDDNALYQIPVIKSETFEYGTYTVTITPMYAGVFDHSKANSYEFWLDAIRIYDPAQSSVDAQKAYLEDNEAYPEYLEVRNCLISAEDFGKVSGDRPGAVFIDGFGTEAKVADYTNYGPNNEVYLSEGQAVAFELTTADRENIASIQVGAKGINGEAVTLMVNDKRGTINTATDMYFDITNLVTWKNSTTDSDPIILSNANGGIVSITNIKITYKNEPAVKSAVYSSENTVLAAAAQLNSFYLARYGGAEVEEPEMFEPATFSAKLSKSSVKAGGTVTVTVTTSGDVAKVTVNGKKATKSSTSFRTGNKTWTCSIKATEAGAMDLETIAYNSDGLASAALHNALTVTGKTTSLSSLFGTKTTTTTAKTTTKSTSEKQTKSTESSWLSSLLAGLGGK